MPGHGHGQIGQGIVEPGADAAEGLAGRTIRQDRTHQRLPIRYRDGGIECQRAAGG